MPPPSAPAFATGFLQRGGEMGAIMRAHDWAATPLGPPEGWPQSLRISVRLMLNTRQPIFIFWGPQALCFYNDAYRQSIGPERHPGALGQPGRAVWEEIWPIIGPQIEQVMAGGNATWNENHLVPITRNGQREDVYWTYSYSPIDDDDAPGGVGGVLVLCAETTQAVVAGRELAASQERLQLALSGGRGIGTWDWDVVHDRVVADARFAELYGVDPQKARTGAPLAEFFTAMHPDDVPRLQQRIGEVLATGELFSEEYRLLQPDGSVAWVMAEGRPRLDAEGRAVRFPGVTYDITDRKRIEAQLRELNTELERKVIERAQARGRTWQVSPDLLGALNSEGCFETSNPAWRTVLGWSEQEVAGVSLFDLLHPDDVARTRAGFNLTQQGQPAIQFPTRCRRKEGGYRWISWVGVPEDGMVYCSGRDITEEKEQAEALQAAEEALRQSQKMEAVGQLTGGIAHDFNNLLAGISGSLELIQARMARGQVDAVERYVGVAKGAVKRASALTHRLLAFSRRQTLDPKPTNVNRLVADMEELVRRTVGPAVVVEVVGAGGLWTTLVDPNQLENALLNLCINARDAMPHGGRLTIETANKWLDDRAGLERDLPPGQYISLCVSDNGTGMAPEVITKAFDPFFTTKPLGQGTGLGLSMIYGFARQSGGQVRIYSEVEKGTTMCLYLPRHDAEPAAAGDAVEGVATTATGDGQVVLVVDDEPTIRLVLAEVLADAGYGVLEAADGPAGLRVLQSAARIDLLITDVGLPGGLNGRQVADAARVQRPGLGVLFITGYAENAAIGNGHLDPGMAVVTKPFEMEALVLKIRQMLDDAAVP